MHGTGVKLIYGVYLVILLRQVGVGAGIGGEGEGRVC